MSSWGSRTAPVTRIFFKASRVSQRSTGGLGPHSLSILLSSSIWLRDLLISVSSAVGRACRQRSLPIGEQAFFSRRFTTSKNSRAFSDLSSIKKSAFEKPFFTLAREPLSYHFVDGFSIRLSRQLGHDNLHHLTEVSQVNCLGFLDCFIYQRPDFLS